MKRVFCLLVLSSLFVLSACSPQLAPAATPTPEPTTTPTPKPFTGKLFFDMNGSGLQDESSFVYDPERLADPRQPLQPDLDKAIKDYVAAHPNLKNGDLVTIPEPGLSGYRVCSDQDCATTSSDGRFLINNKSAGATALLKITDPYASEPALAMRYINEWKGAVVVPAYTKDTNASTIKNLSIIPNCDSDKETPVCKQDKETLLVRDQNLNDTKLIPIENRIYFDLEKAIGLTQGFFNISQEFPLTIQFDLDNKNGIARDWLGRSQNPPSKYSHYWFDNHTGIDFLCREGEPIKAFTSGVINSVDNNDRGALYIEGIFTDGKTFHYGHESVQLVKEGANIYRGQIIALCGHTGSQPPWPHIHFQLGRNGTPIDAFADLNNSEISTNLWTVYNLPFIK